MVNIVERLAASSQRFVESSNTAQFTSVLLLLLHMHIMCSTHFPVIVRHSDLVISTANESKSTWECSLLLFRQWILTAAAGVQRKQQTCCLDQLIVPPLRIWDISDLFIYRLAFVCQLESEKYVRRYWLRLMMKIQRLHRTWTIWCTNGGKATCYRPSLQL